MDLKLSNISFSYGAVEALSDVSMTMRSGRVTCIIGRNGVGKTTLMRNVIGNYRSSSGSIHLGQTAVHELPAHRRVQAGLALVPQGREIFPKLTVEENLQVGLLGRVDGVRVVPGAIYDMFPILRDFSRRRGGDLSGGQQQQLAIARALCGDPKVLLLDEPTEGIQPNVIQKIGHVLRQLADEQNMTVVLVEQYLDFVREFADDFYIMNRGRVVADGATAELSGNLIVEHLSV
jgi:urea transport system ATP-binding protein